MMEAHVWVGPFERFEEGTLSYDGDTITLRGGGAAVTVRLSEAELGFPPSMCSSGFVLTVRGVRTYVWFVHPSACRNAAISALAA